MAKLIRILKKFLMRKSGSAVSAVDADTMAEKRIPKMSKRQLKEKVKELEKVLSKADQQLNLERKKYEQERIRAQVKNDKTQKKLQLENKSQKAWIAEAEKKNQKNVDTIEQLESERASLNNQVESLQKSMQSMGKQLSETSQKFDELTDDSFAEEKEKHRRTVESIALLESKKSSLASQVNKLQRKLHSIHKQLADANNKCDVLRDDCELERDVRSSLQEENDKLKDSLAEEKKKLEKTADTIALLESEKSGLTSQVERLQETVHAVGKQLAETHNECDKLTDVCKREREACGSLQVENDKLKEMLMQKEESLKDLEDCLAEEKKKHEKTVKTIALLESEKSGLTSHVESLEETVYAIGKQLTETQHKCDELTDVCKREREARGSLQVENYKLKETLMQKEEPLKDLEDCLVEEKKKHEKTVETIALLKSEKSGLTSQVERLQETVHAIGKQLAETHKECDKLTDDCKRERIARSDLQVENTELKNSLMQQGDLLMELQDALDEEQEKHQKTLETITLLESEKSSLTSQVKSLQETVHSIEKQLAETHNECEKLIDECQLEREARCHLLGDNIKMKETLVQKEESLMDLRDSLAEEKEKHQKTVKIIALLESEKSSLTSQVNSLQETLHSTDKQLADANNKCDVLRDECQLEREAHGSLQEENDKLKESLAEERGNKQIIESLELQKNNMALDVVRMRQKVQRMTFQLDQNEEVINQLTDMYEQQRQKCSSLQAEHDKLKETLKQNEPQNAKHSVPKKLTPAPSRVQPYVQAIHKPKSTFPKRKK